MSYHEEPDDETLFKMASFPFQERLRAEAAYDIRKSLRVFPNLTEAGKDRIVEQVLAAVDEEQLGYTRGPQ